ncbi:MAG: hypothetical protein IH606_16755 [Burkholderiales bacterium]|nr:hypothetical protein [Burkholderiales bacterium]
MNKLSRKYFLLLFLIIAGFSPQAATANVTCTTPLTPKQNIFKNLSGVSLYVDVLPASYLRAEECHNREAECVENTPALKRFPEMYPRGQERFIQELVDDYKAFPAPLHRENLIRLFTARIKRKYSSFIAPDNNCQISDVTIIDKKTLNRVAEDKDNVTIIVRLRILQDTKPQIALLTTDIYRGDPQYTDLTSQVLMGDQTAIPLDLPEDRIADLVSRFANGLFVPTLPGEFDK